ncbi:tyrosine-type recombinase/integrase [Ferrimonas balearica]|uniref:tyrosine-type recombinase/integrase n=1 Tax=Ferrimonas balearica TaxID=44012 RepID=UPI001FEE1CB8|nr:site-specific integrase [Ferrimonas balearica]
MKSSELKKIAKAGNPGKYAVGDGLYLRVSAEGSVFWIVRYTIHGKRREITVGRYGELAGMLSLAQARIEAARVKDEVRQGIDPIAEKKRPGQVSFNTVNDLAYDWLKDKAKRVKNPQIPQRLYQKDIAPLIGELSLTRVKPMDIRNLCAKIADSGRPTVANDALSMCKQLFSFGQRIGAIEHNPALPLKPQDAGGEEKSRTRILSIEELGILFEVLRTNSDTFTRSNYLAIALLLCLGVRKGELIGAKWEEFNTEAMTWALPASRSKTGVGIVIPLAPPVAGWLNELRFRAAGSEYVFPARRASKRRGYISDDTLNHALSKLFGQKVDSKKQPMPNVLGQAGIEHFTVHDLRRTCRSLLSALGTPSHIAERCINHKLKGVEAIYDRYDYLDERRDSLSSLASRLEAIINHNANIVPFLVEHTK